MQYRNFHLPLTEEMYAQLRLLAKKKKVPATTLARGAIEKLIQEAKRSLVYQSIQAYAEKHSGTEVDLDPVLAEASAEYLREEE